jgi:hypothetical protein
MTDIGVSIVRPALPHEIGRALRIFEADTVPASARLLVLVKSTPVERILGALAWWREDEFVKFALARLPGVVVERVAGPLLDALDGEIASAGNFAEAMYFAPLAETDEWTELLARRGFAPTRMERVFEVPFATTCARGAGMIRKFEKLFPPTWRTEAIRNCAPEIAWPLVAPHRLLTAEALRTGWSAGFHQLYSSILFDGTVPIGVFLVRVSGDRIAVDVRVVNLRNSRLRALGNLALLAHIERQANWQSLRVAVFRGDAKEHVETANMAIRMGGREVSRRHIFSKPGCQ